MECMALVNERSCRGKPRTRQDEVRGIGEPARVRERSGLTDRWYFVVERRSNSDFSGAA